MVDTHPRTVDEAEVQAMDSADMVAGGDYMGTHFYQRQLQAGAGERPLSRRRQRNIMIAP